LNERVELETYFLVQTEFTGELNLIRIVLDLIEPKKETILKKTRKQYNADKKKGEDKEEGSERSLNIGT
jgi:hypothetical protein